VETIEGPLLVLAGAGTGKTRVITSRIAELLRRKVSARQILAVTFTKKAAREMRDRVSGLVGAARAKELSVGTFHSFCAGVLRAHHAEAGLSRRFGICDAADQLAAARATLRELRVAEARLSPRALLARVSLAKNRQQSAEGLLSRAGDDTDELLGRAWRRYEERLARSGVVDFDDLLLRTLALFERGGEALEAVRGRSSFILVDEFQDTNGPQYGILRALCGEHDNICAVGDDDQSIYAWRGADPSHILGFERDFPGAKVVRLETNYRSCAPILRAANRVISNNTKRHEKGLHAALGEGSPVVAWQLKDGDEEARWVVHDILEWTQRGGGRLGSVAVLFRAAAQARAFEAELRAKAVPYVLVGGQSFFDRKEVRDVLAYLRLIQNPDDEVSFLRVINCPPRGVGKVAMERALAHSIERGISVPQAFARPGEIEGLPAGAADSVSSFQRTLASFERRLEGKGLPKLIRDVLEVVGYRKEVERLYSDHKQCEDRWRAALGLAELAETHVARTKAPSLQSFLEDLALSAEDERDGESERDAVTLMTLHAAKGLEFPRVYLVGMEEGVLPHARSLDEDGEEEERRLAYVGITRAQHTLTLTYAKERVRFGTRVPATPSRFLFEMRGESPPEGWVAANAPERATARSGAASGAGARGGQPRPARRKARRRKVYKNL